MKNKRKRKLLALVLCMAIMLSNSNFIFASVEGTEHVSVSGEDTQQETQTQQTEIPQATEEPAEVERENTGVSSLTSVEQTTTEVQETPTEQPEKEKSTEAAGDTGSVEKKQPTGTGQNASSVQSVESTGSSDVSVRFNEETELKQEVANADKSQVATVTAKIPAGAFPADASEISMEVTIPEEAESARIEEKMQELLPENYPLDSYVLYQIDFKVNGETAQPDKAVAITIEGISLPMDGNRIAEVFSWDISETTEEQNEKTLTKLYEKDQLLQSLEESGQGTENLESYEYAEVNVQNGSVASVSLNCKSSAVYGCCTGMAAAENQENLMQSQSNVLPMSEDPFSVTDQDEKIQVTLEFPENTGSQLDSMQLHVDDKTSEVEPVKEGLLNQIGGINTYQCYDIYLSDEQNDHVELPDGTKVAIEYLNGGFLAGESGKRELSVLAWDGHSNFDETGTDISAVVNDQGYQKIQFTSTSGGPYVLASKYIFEGYISNLTITAVEDGTAPFDDDDEPGNDSNDSNGIVRSYDMIKYDLQATFGARDVTLTQEEALLHFELVLDKGITEAEFDVSQMLWLGDTYLIEYLSEDGSVIVTRKPDGKYYDANGNETSINALVSDSQKGEQSYTAEEIASQRITGTATVTGTESNPNVLSGQKTFSAAINVRNSTNGETIRPEFRLWLDDNEENYGPETVNSTTSEIEEPVSVENTIQPKEVKVSASGMYNLQLLKAPNMSYRSWFNFETGDEADENTRELLDKYAELRDSEDKFINAGRENPAEFVDADGKALGEEYSNYRYGRITGYGLTLQLLSSDGNNGYSESKGLRGMTLPVGEITFDLTLKTSAAENAGEEDSSYTSILWEYNENISTRSNFTASYVDPETDGKIETITGDAQGSGTWERRMYWNNESRTPYAKGAAPSNYKDWNNGCYYGGDWTIAEDKTMPSDVMGDDSEYTYSFTVDGYDFDFDNDHFPWVDAGNSGTKAAYTTFKKGFSAGYIQVLTVFPRVQEETVEYLYLKVEVNDLSVTSRGSAEVDSDCFSEDDNISTNITLYAPGTASKGNSFNGSVNGNAPTGVSSGYLGTDYWNEAYDCSAYAGDEIWILGYGLIGAGSDNKIKAMNLLQLFDSTAFSISDTPDAIIDTATGDTKGTATFLYAADPDYPGGYDTNIEGMQEYMSSIREEDLLYFTDLMSLKEAGYTCIGVLMELRDCDLLSGLYEYLRIPVRVNDDAELVNQTVSTVNTVRIWSDEGDMSGISWKNSEKSYDSSVDDWENELDGYADPDYALVNTKEYIKSEYENGQLVSGTHSGGVLYGNSLLILSYKAGINIRVDKEPPGGGSATYDMDKGENVVSYILHNIRTERSAVTGQDNEPETELTIRVKLDEGDKADANRRILIGNNSFTIRGYQVGSNDALEGTETDITISTDENHPTEVGYYYEDENGNKESRVIRLYASVDASQQTMTLVIKDAPVGERLPDITFQGLLQPAALQNNDTIQAEVTISGSGDQRAYSETAGNMDTVSIGIVQLASSFLSKSVDKTLTELNGEFQYTINYSNMSNSSESIDTMYFYDVLPYSGDSRGSDYLGELLVEDFVVDIKDTAGESIGNPNTEVKVYYSGTESKLLLKKIEQAQGDQDAIQTLLVDDFEVLGTFAEGSFTRNSEIESGFTELDITGLYMEVNNLAANTTLSMTIKVQPQGNLAGDVYGNVAYSWIADGNSQTIPSNQVQTTVLSRKISGLVWEDQDWDGIRDEEEPLLENVNVTLFVKGSDGGYQACTADITGSVVQMIETDSNGEYVFDKLAAGDYIVAFSGEILEDYTGATVYQTDGGSEDSNDGVALSELQKSGIDTSTYVYAIQYSQEQADIKLHTVEEIQAGGISAENFVEAVSHQDLGLTKKPLWQLVKRSSSSTEGNNILLPGAEFELSVQVNGSKVTYSGISEEGGVVTWKKDGKVVTGKFPDGTYTLTETKAPLGYALGDSITFEIQDGVPEGTGDFVLERDQNGIWIIYYDNTAIYSLPSADGNGIYGYLFSGMLLLLAAVLMVYKQRRGEVLNRK